MDRRIGLGAVALALFFFLLPAEPADAARKEGEIVRIDGQVLDRQGRPVDGVVVVLEASREAYSLRRMLFRRESAVEPPLRQTAKVDDQGRFQIEWHWDRHYNRFALSVGFEIQRAGTPDFEILERRDVTERMTRQVPVHVTVKVDRVGYARWMKRFLAGHSTAAEEKIFREVGRPDRIEEIQGESSWWFFTLGKVYRFKDGEFEQVIHFDPLKSDS